MAGPLKEEGGGVRPFTLIDPGVGGPPNFKIAISRKISPLTCPENSSLFLKRIKKAICKGLWSKNVMFDCLEAAKKSRVAKKKCKNMTFPI